MNDSEKPMNIINSSADSKLYEYKLGIERITSELTKFGLTKSQAKVFIFLGKYGSKTSPQVCKDLKLPRTETYHILNVLTNRGLVVTEFSHPTRFSALSLEKAITTMVHAEQAKLSMLAEKQKEISKLWKQIPCFYSHSNEPESEKFQMLQGFTRIQSKMNNMISTAKMGCQLLCGAKDLSRFYYSNLIEMFETDSLDMKLIISSKATVNHFLQKMKSEKIRVWSKNMTKNQCFLIKDDDELLIFLRNASFPSSKIFAFWTDSKSLIYSIQTLFNYSWKNSKPLKQEKMMISNSI